MWDETEAVLKSAFTRKEEHMLKVWVDGWMQMICFPRLHIITENQKGVSLRGMGRAHELFGSVPNVTFHSNDLPALFKRQKPSKRDYLTKQWHLMWADNYTTARFIIFFDSDSIPMVPLRCHHLFDPQERPLWHAWIKVPSSPWTKECSAVFVDLHRERRLALRRSMSLAQWELFRWTDFSTYFPMVVPRPLLRATRELLEQAFGTYFDDAFVSRMQWPSHFDLLGKTAALLHPEQINVTLCPQVEARRNRSSVLHQLAQGLGAESGLPFRCLRRVGAVEHVRHPNRGCNEARCRYLGANLGAGAYAEKLLNSSKAFVRGNAELPVQLFYYRRPALDLHQWLRGKENQLSEDEMQTELARTRALRREVGEEFIRAEPGRVCGGTSS